MMVDPEEAHEKGVAEQRIGELIGGRYQLEAVQGIGGFGVVFRGLDTTTGDLVAVKTLRPELARASSVVARFIREARIGLKLSHPAIPRGIDVGTDSDANPFLVMEFVPGDSLDRLVERDGPLALPQALSTCARVADALSAAHQEGVIHRDIKPENLMLLRGASIPEGICVLDFGIALCVDEPRFTRANVFVGSPAYMPPEQARGELVTPSGDLYALGATLVHLLTGAPMYDGSAELQIIHHATAPVPDLRARVVGLPSDVGALLHWMLQKDPSDRPGSALDVAARLYLLAARHGGPAAPTSVGDLPIEVFAQADPGGSEMLLEQLNFETQRLHTYMKNAADAQNRLVKRLVEVASRRIEDVRRGEGVVKSAGEGHRTFVHQTSARERAIEQAIEELQRRARADQDEILARIRDLQRRIHSPRK